MCIRITTPDGAVFYLFPLFPLIAFQSQNLIIALTPVLFETYTSLLISD